MKNINILKRKRHVGINVVFLELILKLYDVKKNVCFMQNIFIAPFRPSHRLGDPKMSGVNNICLHCGHFIHCYILLNFVLFYSSS